VPWQWNESKTEASSHHDFARLVRDPLSYSPTICHWRIAICYDAVAVVVVVVVVVVVIVVIAVVVVGLSCIPSIHSNFYLQNEVLTNVGTMAGWCEYILIIIYSLLMIEMKDVLLRSPPSISSIADSSQRSRLSLTHSPIVHHHPISIKDRNNFHQQFS